MIVSGPSFPDESVTAGPVVEGESTLDVSVAASESVAEAVVEVGLESASDVSVCDQGYSFAAQGPLFSRH